MRQTSSKEVASVLQLSGADRFRHFVKRVADQECAWGLWKDGWAAMSTSENTPVFPLWPAPEYADLLATGRFSGFEARRIPLEELLSTLLPTFAKEKTLPGVFPTPNDTATTPSPEALSVALKEELEKYE
jgi:hypothetical protein